MTDTTEPTEGQQEDKAPVKRRRTRRGRGGSRKKAGASAPQAGDAPPQEVAAESPVAPESPVAEPAPEAPARVSPDEIPDFFTEDGWPVPPRQERKPEPVPAREPQPEPVSAGQGAEGGGDAFAEGVQEGEQLQQQGEGRRRRRRRRGRGGRGRNRNGGDDNGAVATEQRSEHRQEHRSERRSDAKGQPHPRAHHPRRPEEHPAADHEEDAPTVAGERVMLINVAEGEECRIAILHQGRLEELFMERASTGSHVGNIYKGRVTNVEPSIQAAFVDFGLPKNGFLHVSDLQPQYFPDGRGQMEEVGRKTPRRDRPPIQRCLRRGQEVIVQIIKEGIGTKGPTLTTYISIPGRYLVMMPGMNRLGVSRKIENEDDRRKMRQILDELELPHDMGFILRTAGLNKTKRDLQRDQLYLQRLWKVVAGRIKNDRAPCELYQESDLVIRTIRDVYSSEFGKIIVDDQVVADKVVDFLSIAMPRTSAPVELYKGIHPLFHKYGIEAELERINTRHVSLPSGGSLVIDSTEALVAIDVNSGRYRDLDDAEETAYRINIEAAEEIARQLRLRDLGGLILCDFIDMRMEKHRRGVERALRESLKKHKERAKCLRMSQFGIIEMTRQRMRPSIKRSIYQDCPHCRGSGLVKTSESMMLDLMRLLRLAIHHDQVETVEVRVSPTVAFQLQNRKRAAIHTLEVETGRKVVIRADDKLGLDQYFFECLDRRGGTVRVIEPPDQAKQPQPPRSKRHSTPASETRVESHDSFEDAVD